MRSAARSYGLGKGGRWVRAFTLIELLIVIMIIVVLIGLLLPALAKGKKAARLAICMSNMRQIDMALMNYATDGKSWLGVFSWRPGYINDSYSDLFTQPAEGAFQAHADQAVYIARKTLSEPTMLRVTGRMLSRNYSYMPLIYGGYLANGLPSRPVVCPDDRDAIIWQINNTENPGNILFGTGDPDPGGSPAFHRFLAFWSTYQTVPAAWSEQTGGNALSQADTPSPGNHLLYWWWPYPDQVFFNTRLEKVGFPSCKVYQFDLFDRHSSKRNIFHAYGIAKQPLSFFDGSVRVMRTDDANKGWNPRTPTSMAPTTYYYYPAGGEPPTMSGNAFDTILGYYRWTRNGIKGVDFAGSEVMYP
jgi:prepilin-type N-terminal cleavage/methylation domain-containing protein